MSWFAGGDGIRAPPQQVEFMNRAGMPLATPWTDHLHGARTAVPAYTHAVDFVPGVEAYDVVTLVELHASADSVRLLLTVDAMHDEIWTGRMAKGWESELEKLERALAGRHK